MQLNHCLTVCLGAGLLGLTLLSGCTTSTTSVPFATRVNTANYQPLITEVNRQVDFDWAEEQTIRLAQLCSEDSGSAECNLQAQRLAEVFAALRQRCEALHDGVSCNLGTLLSNHLKSKLAYFDGGEEDYFSLEGLRMAKQGCALKYAASCDDYGYAFLSENRDLLRLGVAATELSSLQAVPYFKQSCELGYVRACERLHYLYTTGELNQLRVKINEKTAQHYLRLGCRKNPQDFIDKQLCKGK